MCGQNKSTATSTRRRPSTLRTGSLWFSPAYNRPLCRSQANLLSYLSCRCLPDHRCSNGQLPNLHTNAARTINPHRSAARTAIISMCAVSYWCTESRTLPKPGSISLCVFRCDLHLVDQAVGADLSQGAFFFLAGPLKVTPTSPFIHPGLLKSCQRCVGVAACIAPPQFRRARLNRELVVKAEVALSLAGPYREPDSNSL